MNVDAAEMFEGVEGVEAELEGGGYEHGGEPGHSGGYDGAGGEVEVYLDEQTGQVVDAQGWPVDLDLLDPGQVAELRQAVAYEAGRERRREDQYEGPPMPSDHEIDQAAADLEDRYPALRDTALAERWVEFIERNAIQMMGGDEAAGLALARSPQYMEQMAAAAAGQLESIGYEVQLDDAIAEKAERNSFFS